jgi:cell division protein FtsA
VAVGLRTGPEEAETLKLRSGDALAEAVSPDDQLRVSTVGEGGDERVPRRLLAEIIQPRLEEIFLLAREDVKRGGAYDYVAGGVVITGGGSLLPHTAELASEVFDGLPVRIGRPRGIRRATGIVDTPVHATGIGLALYGVGRRREQRKRDARGAARVGKIGSLKNRFVSWLRGE